MPLGAVLSGGTLVVTLARSHPADVLVETSGVGSPGSWQDVGTIPAGESAGEFATWGEAGLAVRVRLPGGRASAAVFTVDPRAGARPTREDPRPRMRREHTEETLFDEEAECELQRDLLRLAKELSSYQGAHSAPRVEGAVEQHSSALSVRAQDRWEEYLEDCERTFGVPLTVRMFGSRTRPGEVPVRERWVLAGAQREEEEARPEEGAQTERDGSSEDGGDDVLLEQQKARWRAWTPRAVDACVPAGTEPAPPLPLRLLITRVVIRLLGRGVWTGTDDSWRLELARLVHGLIRAEEAVPDQALEQARLVTAVGAGLLLDGVPLNAGTEDSHMARETWSRVRGRVALADPRLDSGLLLTPEVPHARVLGPVGLERVIRLAKEKNPLVHVREELLEEYGWSLTAEADLYRVRGSFPNPVPVAARVAEILSEDLGTVIVHAQGPKSWALLVWARPMMLLASAPRGSAWRLYRVDSHAGPSSRLRGEPLSRVGLLRESAPLHRAPHPDVAAFLRTLDTDHITLLERAGFLTAADRSTESGTRL
jgi:hypothetical protein